MLRDRFHTALHLHQWRTASAAGVFVALLVIAYGIAPRVNVLIDRLGTWRQQHAQVQAAADWQTAQHTLLQRHQHLQHQLEQLYVSLPSGDHMSAMLEVLQAAATTASATLLEVRPAPRQAHTTYEYLPFSLTLGGTFHELAGFVNALERTPYLIQMQALTLEPSLDGPHAVTAQLLLRVVTLKASPAA